MGKGTRVDTATRIFEKSHAAGISNHFYIMFGFPGETREEAQETVDYLVAHRQWLDGLSTVGAFYLADGSPIVERPERWGITINDDRTFETPVGSLSAAEAETFLRAFMKKLLFGSLEVSSAPLATTWHFYANIARTFLVRAYRFIEPQLADTLLDKRAFESLFPMIGGRLADAPGSDGLVAFTPCDFQEPPMTRRLATPGAHYLDCAQTALVAAADGTRSLADIMESLGSDDAGEQALAFLRGGLHDHWALAFGRPWPVAPPHPDQAT
jgi:hypothetical protein